MKFLYLILLIFTISCGENSGYETIDNDITEIESELNSWNLLQYPNGITIILSKDMESYWTEVNSAGDTWNQALGFEFFKFTLSSEGSPQWEDPFDPLEEGNTIFGIYQLSSWDNFLDDDIDTSTLAITANLIRGRTIIHSDIIFNFQYYNFGDVDSNSFLIDFESVFLHELGHLLGLRHVTEEEDPRSIMLPTLRRGEKKRTISLQDKATIQYLYE